MRLPTLQIWAKRNFWWARSSTAVRTAEKSVALAEKRANDEHRMGAYRTIHADALHAAGELEKAESIFADAERRQQELEPEYPLLYSLWGYRYCDLVALAGAPCSRSRSGGSDFTTGLAPATSVSRSRSTP